MYLIWCQGFSCSVTASVISDKKVQKTQKEAAEKDAALIFMTVYLITSRVLLNSILQLVLVLCPNLTFESSKFGPKFQFSSVFYLFVCFFPPEIC